MLTSTSSEVFAMSLRVNTFQHLPFMQALPTVFFCRPSWFFKKGFVIILIKIADFFIFRQFQIASGTAFIEGGMKFAALLLSSCIVWKARSA